MALAEKIKQRSRLVHRRTQNQKTMAHLTTPHASGGGPGLHALVIGAGEYRFGGRLNLRSIGSPVESAKAMANWLLASHRSKETQLHSLDVLISGGRFSHGTTRSREPTLANLRQAVQDWKDRANGHADNQMLFYFCGHGVSVADQALLLASDYGRETENKYRYAVNFRGMLRGLRDCSARKQLFLVDTCRTSNDDDLIYNIVSGDQIFEARHANADCDQATVFAARLEDEAKGGKTRPSNFMRAFLSAVEGPACEPQGDKWIVGPASLLMGINNVNREDHPTVAQVATGHEISENFNFHEPACPLASVDLACEVAATQDSALQYWLTPNFETHSGAPLESRQGPSPWKLKLKTGDYTFTVATSADADHSRWIAKKTILPPRTNVKVERK